MALHYVPSSITTKKPTKKPTTTPTKTPIKTPTKTTTNQHRIVHETARSHMATVALENTRL
jgi:hypothetical protein